MAFTPDTMSAVVQSVGGTGIRMFTYTTSDPILTVTGTGYFADARARGLRTSDLIFVSLSSASTAIYVLIIDVIETNGSGTAVIGDDLGASLGPYATQAEAIAGIEVDRVMSPLRTKQLIEAYGGATFSTIAAFQAATIDAGVSAVAVRGYYAEGDIESPILLEETTDVPGTNLFKMSGKMDTSYWTQTRVTVGAGVYYVLSDSEIVKADTVIPSVDNNTHAIVQAVTVVSGATYTHQVRARANGYNHFRLQFGGGFAANTYATFDLSLGTATAGPAGTCGIVSLGNSEYLCWLRAAATSSVSSNFNTTVMSDATTTSFIGNGSSVRFWKSQLDASSSLTDYVPTKFNARTVRPVRGYVTNTASSRVFKYNTQQEITTRKLGAKCTAVDNGYTFTGDDDTDVFRQGIMFCSDNKIPLVWSRGDHYIAHQALSAGAGYISIDFNHVVMKGYDKSASRIFLDEDPTYYTTAANLSPLMFDTGLLATPYYTDTHEIFSMKDVGIRGRWSHINPATGREWAGRVGVTFVRCYGFSNVEVEDCHFTDSRQGAIRGAFNKRYLATRNLVERVAAGVFVGIESSDFICTHNTIRHCDDDPIDNSGGASGVAIYPRRLTTIVAFNSFEDTESAIIYGGRMTVVHGNTFKRSKGNAFSVGYDGITQGAGTVHANVISDNIVTDPFGRFEPTTPATSMDVGSWTATTNSGAVNIAGTDRSSVSTSLIVPGTYKAATDTFLLPYDASGTTPLWGAMHSGPYDTYSSPGGLGITVHHNIVMRTLPEATNYSDWGFGEYFQGEHGWCNPQMLDANWKQIHYQFSSEIDDLIFDGNQSIGAIDQGVAFLVPGTVADRSKAFRKVTIINNKIVDAKYPIIKDNNATASALADMDHWNWRIEGNEIDADPYFRASIRKTAAKDGSWVSDATKIYRGMVLGNLAGFIIRNNVFRNCYDVIHTNADAFLQGTFEGNILQCSPAVMGFSTSNRGIGVVRRAGKAFSYQIYGCDPATAATFNELQNACLTESATIPTTGTYVAGHEVICTSDTVDTDDMVAEKWRRITTGSGHVLDTDWLAVYGRTTPLLSGSAVYDPVSLADGAGVTTTVTVTGAALGDYVDALSFSLDLQGILMTGWVSAANTVSVRFQNETAGVIDLLSGTIRARVKKL